MTSVLQLSESIPYWVLPVVGSFMFFDVHYFLRGILVSLISSLKGYFKKPPHPLEESVYHGICLTTDLDYLWHMNNARYLRECDFGRFHLYISNGIWKATKKLGGAVTLGASTIRYRQSIQLFDRFRLKTKIVCWDDKAFYLEQRFERKRDNFICAIVYAKQTFKRATPAAVVKELLGEEIESPPMPAEIKSWVECNEISSRNLRKLQ